MSIRIRRSGGLTIALCAAETDAHPGDTYLDDAEHYALAAKFADDWQGQAVDWTYPDEWAEMGKHKVRDAETELNNWLAAQTPKPRPSAPLHDPEGKQCHRVTDRTKGRPFLDV